MLRHYLTALLQVVWAMHPVRSVWWPAELLDPFDLPRGRTLPEGCLQGLLTHAADFGNCELWDVKYGMCSIIKCFVTHTQQQDK